VLTRNVGRAFRKAGRNKAKMQQCLSIHMESGTAQQNYDVRFIKTPEEN
jgi:hypothetical protein